MTQDPILFWNEVALEANRVSHSIPDGVQTGPTMSSRALAIVHLAMHDAFFGTQASSPYQPYLVPATNAGKNAAAAVAGAAYATLTALYEKDKCLHAAFEQRLNEADIPAADEETSWLFGERVANTIIDRLGVKPNEPGAGDTGYSLTTGFGHHRQDPENPNQGFHGPFYGTTAKHCAVQISPKLKNPPLGDSRYLSALDEVIRLGGAPELETTTRTPEQTHIGIYWAYDGAKLLGTPPRLYNQIARTIAAARQNSPADNARLLALVNAAMADAGSIAWAEKYCSDLWRPIIGVREQKREFEKWLPLGAPRTNQKEKAFTPPFPAYPSGHATFGAAAFQMVRHFYRKRDSLSFPIDGADNLGFSFVSDELNGQNRDHTGARRPHQERAFSSLWHAIFENAVSRVYLGVHWVFDSFEAKDVTDAKGVYLPPEKIKYSSNVGGVPLGLAIANDIFESELRPAPGVAMTPPPPVPSRPFLKQEPTNIR